MDMDINIEIMLLSEQIAEVRFNSDEKQLKATLLVARAGMLQAEATRQQTAAIRDQTGYIATIAGATDAIACGT